MSRDNNHRSREVVRAEVSALFHTVVASYGLRLGEMFLATFTVYFSTRLFDPEIYGQMNMISMVAGIIQAFGFGWLGSALIRFGKDYVWPQQAYVHSPPSLGLLQGGPANRRLPSLKLQDPLLQ